VATWTSRSEWLDNGLRLATISTPNYRIEIAFTEGTVRSGKERSPTTREAVRMRAIHRAN
jgi:hypothetical protein